ncbi:MAG: YbfB/YjiJ family MFS transporter [Minwuia sp.]|nr:YbfB/YjiJ family MFS transporter [Minwuia sp.]
MHRAWVIVILCALVVGCCLGLARFAFGMLLPGISGDVGLDYAQGGLLGTSYFIGYLVMVVGVPRIVRTAGQRRMILAGLLALIIGMTGMAFTSSFIMLLALYTLTGMGAGGAYVPAMSLASSWFEASHRGRAAGTMLAGAGIGIVLSGLLIPALQPHAGFAGWQVGWLLFALIAAVTLVLCSLALRDRPSELGLRPYGIPAPPPVTGGPKPRRGWLILLHLGVIYSCYGLTYMTYTTFIVTAMIDERGMDAGQAGLFWSIAGFCSIFSGALFGGLSDRIGRRGGLMAASLAQAVSFALVAGDFGEVALYGSIICFGISAWSIPTIMAAAAGDQVGPERAAGALAAITLMFAAGQAAGPVGAGALAEWTDHFGPGFAASAVIALLAIALSALLPARARA